MFYSSEDAQLFYTIEGEGPSLVLLPPMPCDHRFWLETAKTLTSRYRVILPDLRGQGQSEAGSGPITIQKLGRDVTRLLDALQISKALFAGCSIGGYTLFELWREVPARVIAMAFCCSRPQADSEVNRTTRQRWIAEIAQRGSDGFIEAMLGTLIGPTTARRNPEKIDEARAMMQAVRPEAIVALQQGLAARPDSVETAKTIRVPTFVLAGGEDQSSTPADMKLLTEMIRNGGYSAEYNELRDAGHYAPFEQPIMVGKLLRRFFDSVVD
jgi:3-oxoadipate enol-lactonase